MNPAFKKTTCHVLVASMLALTFQTASAGMIGIHRATQRHCPEVGRLIDVGRIAVDEKRT